ncbi:MAG: hypothetical protein JSV52_00125 [Candidatus Zixiibacteriota bacterium]|nr:MAG: hypothetical protein JSV52_00125 [candidate division Zixibacteria bacterium]
MREKVFNVELLIKVQRVTWYLVLIYFAVVYALFLLDFAGASDLVAYGIVLILAATAAKLVVMAEQFRKAGLLRFSILAYVLVLMLAAIVVQRYFL